MTLIFMATSAYIAPAVALAISQPNPSMLKPRIDTEGVTYGNADNCRTSCSGICTADSAGTTWTCPPSAQLDFGIGPASNDNSK